MKKRLPKLTTLKVCGDYCVLLAWKTASPFWKDYGGRKVYAETKPDKVFVSFGLN